MLLCFPQEYYHAIEGIEDMRRAIQFPKLEPPPQDFLRQMEEYVREAPRPLDPKHPGPTKVCVKGREKEGQRTG